jgi:hypothetical protein
MTERWTGTEAEVSTFALDVFYAGGKAGDPALESHVAGCARCRAYLETLASLETPALRLPAAAEPPVRRHWALPAVSALALAAAAFLFVHQKAPAPESDGYVGVKGTPAVQLLLHRGNETHIWDGRSPVRPGDALALKVACEGLKHVAVAAPAGSAWSLLSGAECPAQTSEALPFTLRVDGEPGEEKLAVVLSEGALDDAAMKKAIAKGSRDGDVWVVTFTMPKETETNP